MTVRAPVLPLALGTALALCSLLAASEDAALPWNHPALKRISTESGDLPVPNRGNQQTASLVADLDNDGLNDFVIAERTVAPAVVWYRRAARGWERRVIEPGSLQIEAGASAHDITGNGYLDVVFGGDASSSELWWWENLGPARDTGQGWTRRAIKRSGGTKHHDVLFGDVTGDGRSELVFWNQGERTLYVADIPADPGAYAGEWPRRSIYQYGADGEMAPRGKYPGWRGTHEHEGLDAADIDGDGILDIVGGGRWFQHAGGGRFVEHIIDASYTFVRAAAAQLIAGGRPEVVLVAGDGQGPLMLYEWRRGVWHPMQHLERHRLHERVEPRTLRDTQAVDGVTRHLREQVRLADGQLHDHRVRVAIGRHGADGPLEHVVQAESRRRVRRQDHVARRDAHANRVPRLELRPRREQGPPGEPELRQAARGVRADPVAWSTLPSPTVSRSQERSGRLVSASSGPAAATRPCCSTRDRSRAAPRRRSRA
jgi:hypothetical protein